MSETSNFEELDPALWRLATLASPAVRIEPRLIRRLRLELLPTEPVNLSLDLWWSPLVHGRGPDGISLRPDVRRRLLRRCRAEPRSPAAWSIIQQRHEAMNPSLVLEEELAWMTAICVDAAQIEHKLQQVLRAFATRPGERPNISRWALAALGRLPEEVSRSEAGQQLGALATRALAQHAGLVEQAEGLDIPIGAVAETTLFIGRQGGQLSIGEGLRDPNAQFKVPDLQIRVLLVEAGGERQTLRVGVGSRPPSACLNMLTLK